MSWKAEVIADKSGKWCGNGLTFATRQEADDYVTDLMFRWTSVTGWRSIESDAPATHKFNNGRAEEIKR